MTYYPGRKLRTLAVGDWIEVTGSWDPGEPAGFANVRVSAPLILESQLSVGRRVEWTATFRGYEEETMMAWHMYVDDCEGEGAELAPHAFLEFEWGDRLAPGDRIRLAGRVFRSDGLGYHLANVEVLGLADPAAGAP